MEKYTVITEDAIREMVHQFYANVQKDPALGPIFHHAVGQRWDAHLERLCDFWSTVLLTSKRYYGNPLRAHLMVQGIEQHHFEQWLCLFNDTVTDLFCESLAKDIMHRATRMAARIQETIFDPPEFPMMPNVVQTK